MSSTSSSWRSSPSHAPQRSGADLRDVRLLAPVAVPDRDPVAPPELARDAPGADVVHPVEVDALPLLGHDPHLVALDDLDRRRGELVHAAEPLERDQRLDPLAGAMREGDAVGVGLRVPDQALLPERGDDRLLGLVGGQPRERLPAASVIRPSSPITTISSRPCARPISKSFGSWPGVILSAPVPNSGSTCSSAMIGSRRPTSGRMQWRADQIAVARVVWMDRHRSIGQHRLRAHRGHREHLVRALDRIVDLVQRVGRPRGSRPRGRRSPSASRRPS